MHIHHPQLRLGEAIDVLEEVGIPDEMISTALRYACFHPSRSYTVSVSSTEDGSTSVELVHVRYNDRLFDVLVAEKHILN